MKSNEFRSLFHREMECCLDRKKVLDCISFVYTECIKPFFDLNLKNPVEWKHGYFLSKQIDNIKIMCVWYNSGHISMFVQKQNNEDQMNRLTFNIISCALHIDYDDDDSKRIVDILPDVFQRVIDELQDDNIYLHPPIIENLKYYIYVNGGDLFLKTNNCFASIDSSQWGELYYVLSDLHLLKLYEPLCDETV